MSSLPGTARHPTEVAEFLRAHREELVERWRERVLSDPRVPEANRLREPALRDHVPALIHDLAECISTTSPRSTRPPADRATTSDASIGHARNRFALGYTLDEALREWSHFRAAVIELCSTRGMELSVEARALIHATIDESMSEVALAMHHAATAALAGSESRLARHAAELHAVIASIPDAVFIADHETVHIANRAALDVFGAASVEELRRAAVDVPARKIRARDPVTGATIDLREEIVVAALRGEAITRDVLLHHGRSRRDVVVRASAAPVRIDAQIVAAVATLTDVTEERLAAIRLREEALFRERFVGIVGHDLRNPLASITMSSQMLLRQELREGHTSIVRRIHAASTRMDRMIDALLDLTRSRLGGGIPIDPTAMDLAEIATRVVNEFEGSHPDRTIEVNRTGDLTGIWDPDRIAQVLTNLIGNAIQHGEPGAPVIVALSPGRVEVRNKSAPIPPAVIARIFDPFERATSVRNDAGLGLGLFIAREIVRAHGGTIGVTSEGTATTFVIELPR